MPKEKTKSDAQIDKENVTTLAFYTKFSVAGVVISWLMHFMGNSTSGYFWLTIFGTLVQVIARQWMASRVAGSVDLDKYS